METEDHPALLSSAPTLLAQNYRQAYYNAGQNTAGDMLRNFFVVFARYVELTRDWAGLAVRGFSKTQTRRVNWLD